MYKHFVMTCDAHANHKNKFSFIFALLGLMVSFRCLFFNHLKTEIDLRFDFSCKSFSDKISGHKSSRKSKDAGTPPENALSPVLSAGHSDPEGRSTPLTDLDREIQLLKINPNELKSVRKSLNCWLLANMIYQLLL